MLLLLFNDNMKVLGKGFGGKQNVVKDYWGKMVKNYEDWRDYSDLNRQL